MSMEIEDWMRIPTTKVRKALPPIQPARTGASGRDIIFRTLFPGVFVYLIAYHAFVYNTAVADFYCEGLLDKHQHQDCAPQVIMDEEVKPATGHVDPASIA
jgi:hypothetical protein